MEDHDFSAENVWNSHPLLGNKNIQDITNISPCHREGYRTIIIITLIVL
jgi:hypothetical protein